MQSPITPVKTTDASKFPSKFPLVNEKGGRERPKEINKQNTEALAEAEAMAVETAEAYAA